MLRKRCFQVLRRSQTLQSGDECFWRDQKVVDCKPARKSTDREEEEEEEEEEEDEEEEEVEVRS